QLRDRSHRGDRRHPVRLRVAPLGPHPRRPARAGRAPGAALLRWVPARARSAAADCRACRHNRGSARRHRPGAQPMKTLPDAVRPYRRTPVFTEATVPAALLRAHTTKAGTWGRILVLEGRLRYRILSPRSEEHTSELQSRENLVCRLE